MFKQSGAVEYMKSSGVFGSSKGGGYGNSKRNFYNSFTMEEVTSDGFQGVKGRFSPLDGNPLTTRGSSNCQ